MKRLWNDPNRSGSSRRQYRKSRERKKPVSRYTRGFDREDQRLFGSFYPLLCVVKLRWLFRPVAIAIDNLRFRFK